MINVDSVICIDTKNYLLQAILYMFTTQTASYELDSAAKKALTSHTQ